MINLEKNDESEAGQVQAKLMCKMLWNGRHKSVWCEQKSHILKNKATKILWVATINNKRKHFQCIQQTKTPSTHRISGKKCKCNTHKFARLFLFV